MEIIVHIIQDLNRTLDLGLYTLIDSDRICLLSLSTGTILLDFPSSASLDFYKCMVELRRLITSWNYNIMLGKNQLAITTAAQIGVTYHFDIAKHFKLQKYGKR